jgi:hypothetical protein
LTHSPVKMSITSDLLALFPAFTNYFTAHARLSNLDLQRAYIQYVGWLINPDDQLPGAPELPPPVDYVFLPVSTEYISFFARHSYMYTPPVSSRNHSISHERP